VRENRGKRVVRPALSKCAGGFACAAFDGAAAASYLQGMIVSLSLARIKGGLLLAALAMAVSPGIARAQKAPDGAVPPRLTAPEDKPAAPKPAPQPDTSSPEQHAKLLDELYARLATAPDQETANQVAQAIEQLWTHSGSPTADLLVARASAAAEAENRDLAMKLLNAAVELQPDFAEAWSRRAYLFYLDNDYKRALGDLRRVLALDPRHYKALEGLGNLLLQLGEKKAALEAYDSALKVHPNLPDAKKSRDELKIQVEGQGI
jgi:tetratricopeptide (TPR) repeat protein